MAVAGSWEITINSPMGPRVAKLELAEDGATITGAQTGEQGSVDLYDGAADGDSVSWKTDINGAMGEMTLSFTGALADDKLSGDVQFGTFGAGTWEAVKA
ncbi:MAG TPA: hypothetical protein QGF05_01420 [Dehalococcoidia bacterium]|nr:hypothetical protein [Dehalococcoidia bacterium]